MSRATHGLTYDGSAAIRATLLVGDVRLCPVCLGGGTVTKLVDGEAVPGIGLVLWPEPQPRRLGCELCSSTGLLDREPAWITIGRLSDIQTLRNVFPELHGRSHVCTRDYCEVLGR